MSGRCSVIQRLWDVFCAFFKAEDFLFVVLKAALLPHCLLDIELLFQESFMLRMKNSQALTPGMAVLPKSKRHIGLFSTRSHLKHGKTLT